MKRQNLALFPLGLVAFPKEKLNLHIFEPRYRQLVHECFEEEKTFGIPPYKTGMQLQVGTEMEIIEISKTYDDGKMDIKTRGLRVFRVHEFYSKTANKLYPSGEIEFIENDPTLPSILDFQTVMQLVEEMYELMDIDTPLPEWDEGFSIYEIAHKLGLNFDQEMQLLKIRSEVDRLEYVKQHLLKMNPVVKQMEELRARVKMNGHFKNIIPPNLGL